MWPSGRRKILSGTIASLAPGPKSRILPPKPLTLHHIHVYQMARAEEVPDESVAHPNGDHPEDVEVDGEGSGSDLEDEADGTPGAGPSDSPSAAGASTSSKKKKKKRSKAAKALAALKGDAVPQKLVDTVLEKVKEEHGENLPGADAETVRQLLEQLKIKDVMQGKAGLGGKNRKDAGDHKVRRLSDAGRHMYVLTCVAIVLGYSTCNSVWYEPSDLKHTYY